MKSHKKLSIKKRNTALFRSVLRSRTSFASCVLSASIGYKYLSINLRQNWASTESRARTGPVPRSRSDTQNGLIKSSLTTLWSDLLRAAGRPVTCKKTETFRVALTYVLYNVLTVDQSYIHKLMCVMINQCILNQPIYIFLQHIHA